MLHRAPASPIHADTYRIITATLPNPGAGNPITWTPPAAARVRLIHAYFQIISMGGADAYPTTMITTGGWIQYIAAHTRPVTALAATYIHWSIGIREPLYDAPTETYHIPLPPDLNLHPQDRLRLTLNNIGGFDVISNAHITYHRWTIA